MRKIKEILRLRLLGAVGELERVRAREVGQAAIRAALNAIGEDPSLASSKCGPAVSAVTRRIAELAGQGKLASVQAAELAAVAIDAMARNPRAFVSLEKKLAETVIEAVQENLPDTAATPWAGRMLVQLARETLLAVARSGGPAAASGTAAQFKALVAGPMAAGLKLAEEQLGARMDLDGVPAVLAGLIERALRGELRNFDPADAGFVAAFAQLAAAAGRN